MRKRWAVRGKYHPTAILSETLREQLGATTQVVRLSDETLVKQLVKRGDNLLVADYLRLQPLLDRPDAVIADQRDHWLFYRVDGKVYMAVVKVTAGGSEVYLQSFRRATDAEMRKALEKSGAAPGSP